MFSETQELPFPDDMIVADVPIQLVPGDDGDLLGEKSQTLDRVVPTEYSMASYPEYAERTFEFRRLEMGMGTRRQRDGFPKTYYYDLFIDGSIGAYFGKGPLFHGQDGVTGKEARDGVQGLHGGVAKEFGGFGNQVAVRNGDGSADWAVIKTFAVGRTVMQMARFKNSGTTVTDSVYVVLDNGELHQFDGALWAQATLPGTFTPTSVEVMGNEMFLAGLGELRSVEADPLVAANYSGPIYVGEAGAAVNWLRSLHGQIFVFKEDGLYTIRVEAGTLVALDVVSEFRNNRSLLNGREAAAWRDALWFRWGDALWKLTTEGDGGVVNLEPVGLSVLMENDSEVQGQPVAFAGHNSWFGYFLVTTDTDSYLCKWGTWLNPGENDPERYRFAEVPHGAICKWTNKLATRLWVSAIGGAGVNQKLHVGFSDGTTEYMLLPHATPNPFVAGSGCEYTAEHGKRYLTEVNCDFPSENKSWRGVTVFAPKIDNSNVLRHFYRPSDQTSWVEMTEQFTLDTQRVDFPSNFGTKSLCQYVQLESVSTAETPLIEGIGLHYSVVPAVILEYTGAADARLYRVRRDGSVDERDPDIIRQAILTAVGTIGAVTCTLPDNSQRELNFYRYTEAVQSKWRRVGREWIVPFKAIEFRTNTTYGTWIRVESYTWAQVEAFGSWQAVEHL